MEKNNKNNQELKISDIETIIEVNNKAIELQTENAEQYEEIIDKLSDIDTKLDILNVHQESIRKNMDSLEKEVKEITKTEFKIMILISTGIVSLIVQIASLLKH